jgi:hypothetical protein
MSAQNSLSSIQRPPAENIQLEGHDAPLSFKEVVADEQAQLGGTNIQRSALCISGGGIRSATFALGALQALAGLGILENFDYLSTVSGGGYIGGWLTAWKQRWNGLTTPKQVGNRTTNVISQLKPWALPSDEGPDPIQHLREYNNYLSPKLGFFSADTWTLVATVARNMLLNWLVFIPLLMFALMLPRIVLSLARLGETYTLWYVPTVERLLAHLQVYIPIAGGVLFALGVFNVLRYLPGVGGKNHTQEDFLKYCFAPIFLAALALLTMDAWFTGGDKNNPPTVTFWQLFFWIGISGGAAYLAYFVIYWKTVGAKLHGLRGKNPGRKWRKSTWITNLLAAGALTNFSTAAGAWLLMSEQFRHLTWTAYVTIAMPTLLLSFALAVTVFVGFSSRVLEDQDREWLARAGAWGLLCIVSWAGLCALSLLAPKALFYFHGRVAVWVDSAFAAAGGIGGCLAALAGLSSKTKAQNNGQAQQQQNGGIMDLAGKLAAPVFIVVFLTCLAILTNWILWKIGLVDGDWTQHEAFLENTHAESAVIFAVICVSFCWIMARFININKFSLHAMYRARLIRAYLGASNTAGDTNRFIGFAENDNLQMADLKALSPNPCLKPLHIVNIALNLVSGEKLAWQQRKAESFTVSPLHCGSYGVGYRPTSDYGGEEGISLGTAITISGAAASPNMGYHSSPAIAFIMTLFNARLGAWLGNPKERKWKQEGPKSAFDSILREAFGLTNDTSPYVYLSDGGHFENLALYEMVRRRCRYIVVLDGGCDADYTYEDLGNALRKVRIDMKIPIQFLQGLPQPNSPPNKRCAVARICYKEIDANLENGYLIYIKPVILGTEPPDVTAYKAANDKFPHQSTGDQFFDESQTESYRMLGFCSASEIFNQWDSRQGFEALVENALNYLNPPLTKAAGGKP